MKSRTWKSLGAAALLAAVPATAVMISQQVAAEDEAEGRIVEISPEEGGSDREAGEERAAEEAKQPKYWIGLQSRPLDSRVLRTHLQLADDVGLIVENVVPGSPAEKAGLRQDDVLVAVNGEPISDVVALQKAVADGEDKPLELKVLRLAKETTIKVTPEERPADMPVAQGGGLADPFGAKGQLDIESIFKQLQEGGALGGRMIGPGMVMNGRQFDISKMPGGMSVSITREGDGPAKITVKKGDESWTVEGDDQEAIKQLP